MADPDLPIRMEAFDFLSEQTRLLGDALPRGVLQTGFIYQGRRVPLVGPQGIFKPAVMRGMPLSMTTAPLVEGKTRPYEDQITEDDLIAYRYRGTDPRHHENAGLRRALEQRAPLIYFYGLVPGFYAAAWPAFVVGDDPRNLTFTVAVDEPHALVAATAPSDFVADDLRRRYATRIQLQRLHQVSFRERVIHAYRTTCAICRLRHSELLDAAHILPDTHPKGEPIVPNGLALCNLHHAAFDRNILGVRPDLKIEISMNVREEIDGPMLVYGLQGFHGQRIGIPKSPRERPNTEFLEERYELFKAAS